MSKSKKDCRPQSKTAMMKMNEPAVGHVARGSRVTPQSHCVDALPIVQHMLDRMRLGGILPEHLPLDEARTPVPTFRAILVFVFNTSMSREPIHGTGQWTGQYASDFWHVWEDQLLDLNDDGLGRDLDCLSDPTAASLILVATVRRAVKEFKLSLDELHRDSTSVTVYGPYAGALQEGRLRGRPPRAITWGHNKDHRPDLKQLLYILTVTEDGGAPVDVSSAGGNLVDTQTDQQTWPLLRELVRNSRVMYVADCKMAATENMNYIAQDGR